MSQAQTASQPSKHDSNLIDVLLSSALDGEFVRDQLSAPPKTADTRATQPTTSTLDAALVASLKRREARAIELAEAGNSKDAIAALTGIIDDVPEYASAYNNRAQVHRIEGDAASALRDLDAAIEYGTGRVRAQACTQKGVLMRERGDQDAAFRWFAEGARLGNEVARVAAAKENPYAKLCGKIVQESMRQLRNPAGDAAAAVTDK